MKKHTKNYSDSQVFRNFKCVVYLSGMKLMEILNEFYLPGDELIFDVNGRHTYVYKKGDEQYWKNSIANFSIKIEGNVPLDPQKRFPIKKRKVFPNSIYLEGGFIVQYKYQKQGIGKAIINKLFKDKPNLQNIFLYAIDWQGAIPFWLKIGGEIILEDDGFVYIQIKRSV